MPLYRLVLGVCLAGGLIACSAFIPDTQRVVVRGPVDSVVYANGVLLGIPPVAAYAARDAAYTVNLYRGSRLCGTRTVGTLSSFTGWVDSLAGNLWLLPYIGLLFPGAHALDTDDITVECV